MNKNRYYNTRSSLRQHGVHITLDTELRSKHEDQNHNHDLNNQVQHDHVEGIVDA